MHPTEPNIKRKNQSPMRVIVNRWGFLLGFFMLGIGIAMGLLGAIFVGPGLLGFDVTATALMEREIILAATEVELESQAQSAISGATAFALDVQATQAILNNNSDLLNQTATQSAVNIMATNTSSAIQNVQRQTQIANDFIATRAALDAIATQVELDFRNTQSAPGMNNASISNATSLPRYSFDMSEFDANQTIWQLSDRADWQITDEGLVALSSGAWLLEDQARILDTYGFTDSYRISATIRPATIIEADYWLLFAVNDSTGFVAHFHADTLTITETGLYRFDKSMLDNGLTRDTLTIIQRNASNVVLTGETQLQVLINGDSIALAINDDTVLATPVDAVQTSAIGIQIPEQTELLSIAVQD